MHAHSPICTIIDGRFQFFQRFSGSKLVSKPLKAVAGLNHMANGIFRLRDADGGTLHAVLCQGMHVCQGMHACTYV